MYFLYKNNNISVIKIVCPKLKRAQKIYKIY